MKKNLKQSHPQIAEMAYGWDPSHFTSGSREVMTWICKKGHIFNTQIRYMTSKKKGKKKCNVCSGHQIIVGVNDLQTTDEYIAKEAYGWDPTTVTRGSNKKKKFLCPTGHIYESVVATRALERRGCRICRNQVVVRGFNDLATKFPKIANEADGWDPTEEVFGSKKRKNWKCEKKHSWSATIIGRTQGEKSCPFCSGFRTWSGFNDIATTHPELAKEADGWDPTKIHAGTNKKLNWKCKLGHIWQASGSARSAEGTGCPYCVNFKCWPGFNDIATTHPELSKEAYGWDPTAVIAGSNVKRRWKCTNGHIWVAIPVNRAYGKQTGCPECAISGFKPEKDAWVYLISHKDKGLHQIGISNNPEVRLALHQTKGWEIQDLLGPLVGAEARRIEQMVLATLWRREIKTGLQAGLRKFDGYTESWKSQLFSPVSVEAIIGFRPKARD